MWQDVNARNGAVRRVGEVIVTYYSIVQNRAFSAATSVPIAHDYKARDAPVSKERRYIQQVVEPRARIVNIDELTSFSPAGHEGLCILL